MEKSCFESEVGTGRQDVEAGDGEMPGVLLVGQVEGKLLEGEGDLNEVLVVGGQTLTALWRRFV